MRGLELNLIVVALGLALVAAACEKPGRAQSTTAATVSGEEGAPRPSRPSGSEVACRLHSCAPPYFCNEDTGICEQLHCSASRDCPYGYRCDFSRNVCE
jgi:hypothetical protein